jgi:nitrogen regulatory protein P-II 1
MKKIEAIIKRSNYLTIVNELNNMNYSIIERRNLEDSKIFKKQSASKIGFGIIKTIPLSKIELIISEKDAKK